MSDVQSKAPQASAPGPQLKSEEATDTRTVARRVARKSVSLSGGFAESLGGSTAGQSMPGASTSSAADVADSGFSGTAHEVPHRAEMEKSFDADFSHVRAYSDGPALKANSELGSHAYAMGDQVAFKSANPDKSLVAHELTHVLQNQNSPSYKSDGGIETAGEAQAERVESAVAAGKPATSVLGGGASGGGVARKAAPQRKKRGPSLEGGESGSKFGMGMSFSREKFEKSYSYTLWEAHPPIEIPIAAVPGLNFMVEPSVKVSGSGGVEYGGKNKGNGFLKLGVDGSIGLGFSYGNASVASLYGVMEAKAHGGFDYNSQTPAEEKHEETPKKDDHKTEEAPKKGNWSLAGLISIETAFKVGVKLAGGIMDYSFEFGNCEIGKVTGLYWDQNGFQKDKLGWEWGEKPKEFFAAIKAAIDKAGAAAKAVADGAKKVWQSGKEFAKFVSSW